LVNNVILARAPLYVWQYRDRSRPQPDKCFVDFVDTTTSAQQGQRAIGVGRRVGPKGGRMRRSEQQAYANISPEQLKNTAQPLAGRITYSERHDFLQPLFLAAT
jgi:hypothetical protein